MLKRPEEYTDTLFVSKRLWSRSETRLWTLTLFVGTCVLYASRVALPLCAAAIAKEFSWNKTDSGSILSCFFWGYAITQLIAGGIADRYGGEKVLPCSTLMWVTLTILTPQLFDFAYWTGFPLGVLLFVRILTGVGQGFHVPSMASLVSRHLTAAEKGKVFGFCLAGSHVGTVVAGAVGSILLEWLGWRTLFQFVGILSLAWYWWFHFLLSIGGNTKRCHDSDEEEIIKKPSKTNGDALSFANLNTVTMNVPWGTLFRHPAWWAAGVAQFMGGNAYFTMFNWLPLYFHESFPGAMSVIYNVVPSVAVVCTSMVAPFMATKLLNSGCNMTMTRKVMEGASLCGIALCHFMVPFIQSFSSALVVFTLAMAMRGLHHGGVSVNPHDFAPTHTGAVFGIFNAFGAITGFVGVYVAGHILELTDNNWDYVFVVTGIQCIIGAIVYSAFGTGNKII